MMAAIRTIARLILVAVICLGSETSGAPNDPGSKSEDVRMKAPWSAAIFKKGDSNQWEFLCSGTLTGRYTVLTSARCVLPRVFDSKKLSSRPHHYRYSDLQVVVGLPTSDLSSKDKHTQIGIVGQIRDAHEHHRSGDTPEGDLAVLRLKNILDLSTPYVKSVQLMESKGTLLEANETRSGEILLMAGYEKEREGGVKTRSQQQQGTVGKPLKVFEVAVEDTARCIDRYTEAYPTYYFNAFCGKMQKKAEIIPCHYEGSGLVKKVIDLQGQETFYLFGVYSSNSALAKTEGLLMEKNMMSPQPCTSSDLIFFSRYAHLERWALSSNFCDNELAMCKNDRCRPWGDLCNAKVDCDDGSDENEKICFNQNKECGKDQFRCKYGACIDKKLTCDGIRDCVNDGSDEDKNGICKGKSPPAVVSVTFKNGTESSSTSTCEGIKTQESVTAHCTHPDRQGLLLPCEEPVPIGTTAVLRRKEITVNCGKEGKWSRSTRLTC